MDEPEVNAVSSHRYWVIGIVLVIVCLVLLGGILLFIFITSPAKPIASALTNLTLQNSTRTELDFFHSSFKRALLERNISRCYEIEDYAIFLHCSIDVSALANSTAICDQSIPAILFTLTRFDTNESISLSMKEFCWFEFSRITRTDYCVQILNPAGRAYCTELIFK